MAFDRGANVEFGTVVPLQLKTFPGGKKQPGCDLRVDVLRHDALGSKPADVRRDHQK